MIKASEDTVLREPSQDTINLNVYWAKRYETCRFLLVSER